jgi:LPXTG-motif cell wall-anchored protein
MLTILAHYTGESHPSHADVNFWLVVAGLTLVIIVGFWLSARRTKKSSNDPKE